MGRDYIKIKAWQIADEYEELWTKGQESFRILQGLISYIKKSDV